MPTHSARVLSSICTNVLPSCMVHVRKLFAFYLIVVLDERVCAADWLRIVCHSLGSRREPTTFTADALPGLNLTRPES